MNIELRNLKVHKDVSEETLCFSATIYVNNQRAGTVKNLGRGGPHFYQWLNPALGKEVAAWAETQPLEFEFEKLDQILDRLIDEQNALDQLDRATKTKTLFRLKGDKRGEWRVVKSPFTPQVEEFIQGKYGAAVEVIANKNTRAAVAY